MQQGGGLAERVCMSQRPHRRSKQKLTRASLNRRRTPAGLLSLFSLRLDIDLLLEHLRTSTDRVVVDLEKREL